jgi:glycosyltransferase involved in cell wall biosynthesis
LNHFKVVHITTIDKSIKFILQNQLLSIKDDGYEVFAISSPGPYVPEIENVGIRHIPVSIPRNVEPIADIRALITLCRIMRRENFTIVHTHFSKPGLLGQVAARLAGVPIIINTVHGFAFHENMQELHKRFYILIEKVAAFCSHKLLSQNKEDMSLAIREGLCKPDKIEYLGNGIDLSRFDPLQINARDKKQKQEELRLRDGAPVIGFVGRLAKKRKGFEDFLKAASIIMEKKPDAYFLIIGEPDYGRPDAAGPDLAKVYGVFENCRFMGWVPNEQIPLLMSLMHVLVLPSLLEGIPRSLMEASAMGIPIVAYDVKGNREVVRDGVNGFLISYGDVYGLATGVITLVNDPEKAERIGQEGQKIAHENFDEQIVFKRIKSEYKKQLQNRSLF